MSLVRRAICSTAAPIASNASRARSTVAALSARAPRPVLDDVDGVARLGLDGADERGDRAGGRARLLGELADLLGDDREAAALLARARGLDGGVEREQVGLRGDGGDGLDDAADLLGLRAELADGGGGRGGGLAHGAHRGGRLAHGVGAGGGQAARLGGRGGRLPARRRRTDSSRRPPRRPCRAPRSRRAPGARRRRRPPRRRGRSRPRRGRSPRSRWPAGARPTTRPWRCSDTWPIMVASAAREAL